MVIYHRSQPGFIAPAVAGGEKGSRTAWVVANDDDGSLSLSTEGAPGAQLMTDDRIHALKVAKSNSVNVVAQLYEYMKSHSSVLPSRYVDDDTGTKRNDSQRQAFNEALAGRKYVKLMAHFVAKSRDNPPNSLHIVWDEKEAAKNPNPKRKVGQRTLAEAFKKARKKKD